MEAPHALVVGTAGHIDHGKSSLVRALTGVDPDRLPEERARGMTIDLGFAHLRLDQCDVSFVDVPGHERFIRNMLAGATGVDAAILVVAADDSVMPQTREHAEVLSLLGVARVVIAITKIDLVDAAWADEVERDARALVETLRISPVAVVRTSVQTGVGLDELRAVLGRLARERADAPDRPTWFRLPVDRAFVIAGRGTVVTGTVQHGAVAQHDELELWPAGRKVRVRDLQTHNAAREAASGRTRLAVNIANLAIDDVSRGCTLATPQYLTTSACLDAWIAWLRYPGKVRRKTLRLRLHTSTNEVLVELRLAGDLAGANIEAQFAQLRTAEPLVAEWGQRFILRDESGMRTLGGGRVLRPLALPWSARRPPHVAGLQALLDGPPPRRLEEAIRAAEWRAFDAAQFAAQAGLRDADDARAQCGRLQGAGRIRIFESADMRLCVHYTTLDALAERVRGRLKQYLERHPRASGLPRSQWIAWMPAACPERFRAPLAEWLLLRKPPIVTLSGEHLRPADETPQLAAADQTLLDALLAEFNAAAFQPPDYAALRCRTPKNEDRLRELIKFAVASGQLFRVADGLWLHGARWHELVALVTKALRERGPLTVSDIRSLLNSTRKYVVPIVERLDALGLTKRAGDLRSLGPKAPAP